MCVAIYHVETMGEPVYDSEFGPNIGYVGMSEFFAVVSDDYDGFDFQEIRTCELVTSVPTIGM